MPLVDSSLCYYYSLFALISCMRYMYNELVLYTTIAVPHVVMYALFSLSAMTSLQKFNIPSLLSCPMMTKQHNPFVLSSHKVTQ